MTLTTIQCSTTVKDLLEKVDYHGQTGEHLVSLLAYLLVDCGHPVP